MFLFFVYGIFVPHSAIVVVDIQPIWVAQIRDVFPEFESNICHLLKNAREDNMHIIHVRADYKNSPHIPILRKNSPYLHVTEKTEPYVSEWYSTELENEPVFFKKSFDAFRSTHLEEYLKSKSIYNIYLCGLITSGCIMSTALGAFSCGINSIIIEDCVADRSVHKHKIAIELWENYVFKICDKNLNMIL